MTQTDMPDEIYIPKDMKWRVYFQPHELKSVYQDEKEMTSYIRADLAQTPDGGALDAFDVFEEHLKMKDGTEFIWKDWEDAALYILKLAKKAEQLQKDISVLSAFVLTKNDELRSKAHEIARKVSNE